MNRLTQFLVLGSIATLAVACGGGSALNGTEAVVVLTPDLEEHDPEVNVCATQLADLVITKFTITSTAKAPGTTLTSSQDVILQTWESTPYRTDGGTQTTPVWTNDTGVTVPAGGSADLENYRVYPWEYLDDPPLNYLYPENGGVDPETGEAIIRQSLRLIIYGRTVSGKRVATEPLPVPFRFFCN